MVPHRERQKHQRQSDRPELRPPQSGRGFLLFRLIFQLLFPARFIIIASWPLHVKNDTILCKVYHTMTAQRLWYDAPSFSAAAVGGEKKGLHSYMIAALQLSYHIFPENDMKKLISGAIFIFTAFCLLIGTPGPTALALQEPEISCPAAVVLNAADGEVFYAKNETARVQPADTAMVMTALLAVEAIEAGSASLYAEVTVPEEALEDLPEDAAALLSAGETLTLEELLYLAMLPSAADACNAIACFLSGSVEGFVAQMNLRAAELGCADTYFTNAHGLYDAGMYTTAADMARIAMEAYQHETLMKICSSASASVSAEGLSSAGMIKNTNALLNGTGDYGSSYLYENASGLKAGFNSTAGHTLLASAADPDSGIRLIAAVFGGARTEKGCTSYMDAVKLLDWVFNYYSYQAVLDPNVSIASVDVHLGKDTDYVNLRPASAVTLLLPADYDRGAIDYDLRVYSLEEGKTVTAPVVAGETLGEVSVLRNGQICGTVKLVAATSVDLSRGQYIASHLRETTKTPGFFWLCFAVVVILGGYIAWVIVYRVRRKRYVNAFQVDGASRKRWRRAVRPAAQEPEIEFFSGEEEAAPLQGRAPMDDTTPIASLSDVGGEFESLPAAEPLWEEPRQPFGTPPENPFFNDAPSWEEQEPPGKAPPQDPSIYKNAGRDYFEEFFRRK